jgi:hypothetical protein
MNGVRVAHQDAGEEPGFAKDLKPVADPEHQPAPARMGPHRIHDRRAPAMAPQRR